MEQFSHSCVKIQLERVYKGFLSSITCGGIPISGFRSLLMERLAIDCRNQSKLYFTIYRGPREFAIKNYAHRHNSTVKEVVDFTLNHICKLSDYDTGFQAILILNSLDGISVSFYVLCEAKDEINQPLSLLYSLFDRETN
ncbi:hypothetical protein J437_LFUL014798 [Ladona fulva]|uniref:Uncharacterized protein n=1 Tax=Ladona fulva TaxID=123851 RepID=A0A8K0KIL1_LADFU|nr:hypothetical protein J437_LFUL014798 [Ladona fulva]